MNATIGKFWEAAHHMLDGFIGRLPALIVAVVVFVLFYALSVLITRIVRRATPRRRQNLGIVFGRLIAGATILLGFLVAFSIVAPSFQAGDLIKILGISGVAIGFAFQNILQNFLAGLLLLWAEPFRVGDEIKLDAFEGTVSLKSTQDLSDLKSKIVSAVGSVPGVLFRPAPEALVVNIDLPNSDAAKLRILWWTNAPRQHQMLSSYDKVLTAIAEVLSRQGTSEPNLRSLAS